MEKESIKMTKRADPNWLRDYIIVPYQAISNQLVHKDWLDPIFEYAGKDEENDDDNNKKTDTAKYDTWKSVGTPRLTLALDYNIVADLIETFTYYGNNPRFALNLKPKQTKRINEIVEYRDTTRDDFCPYTMHMEFYVEAYVETILLELKDLMEKKMSKLE